MRKIAFVVSLSVIVSVGVMSPSLASERKCRGTIGAVAVESLRVPRGATCTLVGTRVRGNIDVSPTATLQATGVRVRGNVQSERATLVGIEGSSTIGGNVQLVRGIAAQVADSTIVGNLVFDENTGQVRALRNTIGGNLHAVENTGGVEITANLIENNLQCRDNYPPPTGGGNQVQGDKDGQCAAL